MAANLFIPEQMELLRGVELEHMGVEAEERGGRVLSCEASKYLGVSREDWICGEVGRRYEVSGLLTSGRAVLCEKHALYFREMGYRVEAWK